MPEQVYFYLLEANSLMFLKYASWLEILTSAV